MSKSEIFDLLCCSTLNRSVTIRTRRCGSFSTLKQLPTQHAADRLHRNTHAHNVIRVTFCTGTISHETPDVAIDCGTAESISTPRKLTDALKKGLGENKKNIGIDNGERKTIEKKKIGERALSAKNSSVLNERSKLQEEQKAVRCRHIQTTG